MDIQKSPWFELFSIILAMVGCSVALINPGSAMMFLAICGNITAQLKTIQYMLINLDSNEFKKNLKLIVEYYLQIEKCVASLNKIFFLILNQLFSYYPLIICTLGFTVVTVSGNLLGNKL